MAIKIGVGELGTTIEKLLEEDYKKTVEVMEESAETVANESADALKATSPRRTGKYARSWAVKDTTEAARSKTFTIHSKKHYRLTHLLEWGHAKVNGGRVAARPHIQAVEQKAMADFERKLMEGIGRG